MVSLPVECWTQEGDFFSVTPSSAASLRYFIQDQMQVPEAEDAAAVENRKLLINSLRRKLPSEPAGVTSMFGLGFALGRVVAIWTARRVSPGWMVATASLQSVPST